MEEKEIREKYFSYADKVLSGEIVACQYVKDACKRNLDRFNREDMYFDPEAVDKVINFLSHLKHFTGEFAGHKFELSDWQYFIVVNVFGWKWKRNGLRVTRSLYLELGRKNGKALSIDTPIPTPDGWKTMGELREGDYVFGSDGKPTKVLFSTDVMYNHDCYKVTFEDGEEVIADAEHNWYVKGKKFEGVKTTSQMLDYCHKRNDGKGMEYRYRVPMSKPVEYPEKELPIDPYLLGVWLADGTSKNPNITFNKEDSEIIERITAILGKPRNILKKNDTTNGITYSWYGESKGGFNFLSKLRELSLFGNKHIPKVYLQSSIEQRMELLRGIMDGDGYVSKAGQCEITQVNHNLAYQISELLSSLGIKNTTSIKIPKIYGKECNSVVSVKFYCDKTFPCFAMKRKSNRLKDCLNKRMDWKSIVKIEKVDSVPVKCISVEAEDHLYCFGKNYTLTHNTTLCGGLLLYLMIADGEANASVVLSANSAKQAGLCFEICSNLLKSIDPNDKHFKRYRDTIKFPKTVSKIKVVAADASKLDGENCHAFLCDELHEAPDGSVFNVLETSMGARRQPLAMVATTAGFDLTSFCYDQRTYNLKVLKNVVQDDTLQAFIYCLDDDDDWRDENVWQKANPNLDITISRDYIRSQIAKAQENPALEISIRTKLTNEWCSTASKSFIPMNYIMDATQVINLDDWKDKDITCFMGLDLSSVCDISAIAIMWEYEGKYYFKNFYFLPESALKDSVNKEMYRKWATTNDIIVTPGNSIDYDYIKGKIMELCNEFIIHTIHYDPWQSTYLVQKLVEEGIPVQPYSQSIGSMSKPSKELLRLTLNGSVVLDNNAATMYMFKCAIPYYDVNENLKIKKVSAEKDKIDGVIADVMALAGSLSLQQWDNEIGTTNI